MDVTVTKRAEPPRGLLHAKPLVVKCSLDRGIVRLKSQRSGVLLNLQVVLNYHGARYVTAANHGRIKNLDVEETHFATWWRDEPLMRDLRDMGIMLSLDRRLSGLWGMP